MLQLALGVAADILRRADSEGPTQRKAQTDRQGRSGKATPRQNGSHEQQKQTGGSRQTAKRSHKQRDGTDEAGRFLDLAAR